MKKLVLDELAVESFETAPDSDVRLGTVRGHGFTEDDSCTCFTKGDSCFFSDCGSCALSCSPTCRYTCGES